MSNDAGLKRLLIFDDDADFRKLVFIYLKKMFEGVELVEYDPVAQGVPSEDFDWSQYDVLLLDYYLCIHGVTGLDILQANRKNKFFPATIMLTGAGNEEVAVRALKAGVYEYLRKEKLDKGELRSAILEAFEKHKVERERLNELTNQSHAFNKALFYQQLDQTGEDQKQRVLLLIELDNHEVLEERLGIILRDNIIRHIAKQSFEVFQLGECDPNITRFSDTAVALLIDDPGSEKTLEFNLQGLCKHLEKRPYKFEDKKFRFTVSIGVLSLSSAEGNAEEMIQSVRRARAIANETEGNSYHLYRQTADQAAQEANAVTVNEVEPTPDPVETVQEPSSDVEIPEETVTNSIEQTATIEGPVEEVTPAPEIDTAVPAAEEEIAADSAKETAELEESPEEAAPAPEIDTAVPAAEEEIAADSAEETAELEEPPEEAAAPEIGGTETAPPATEPEPQTPVMEETGSETAAESETSPTAKTAEPAVVQATPVEEKQEKTETAPAPVKNELAEPAQAAAGPQVKPTSTQAEGGAEKKSEPAAKAATAPAEPAPAAAPVKKAKPPEKDEAELIESELDEAGLKLKRAFDEKRVIPTFQPIISLSDTGEEEEQEVHSISLQLLETDGKITDAAEIYAQSNTPAFRKFIDRWMIREAIGRVVNSDTQYVFVITLSQESLADATLFNWLRKLLSGLDTQNPGKSITLEIAASDFSAKEKQVGALIAYLGKSHGFRFTLSQLSSLEQVNKLTASAKFNLIKIEHGLIKELSENYAQESKTSSLQDLKASGTNVIADKVEDATTLTEAISAGADYAIGNFIGEPTQHLDEMTNVESFEII